MFVDKSRTYIGIVENNEDPKKLGRCRVRVIDIFDDIPVDDIPWASPWKDLNGNAFNLPEKGKVVTVIFDSGNIYKPEYIYADHFNVNLEKKLSTLSGTNYTSMKALIFDHKTQIYVNDEEGLKLDHKFNMLNITKDSIDINLKDNFAKVNIGSAISNQQAILGNHFLDWFDEFIQNLLGANGGPFLGNLGAPVVANPEFIDVCQKYIALKVPKFLSHHVNIVDNEYVEKLDRVNDPKLGDNYKSTSKNTTMGESEKVDYTPVEGNSSDTPADIQTPNSSGDGGSGTSDAGSKDPGPIEPTGNLDVDRIIETMQKLGYTVFERPYECNIVGIRMRTEGMKYSNAHEDQLWLFYKDESYKWQVYWYKISTMPGYFKAKEALVWSDKKLVKKLKTPNYALKKGESWTGNTPNGESIDCKATSIYQGRGGMGILREAQYLNVYSIGVHSGATAMVTKGRKQKAYRDKETGDTIKYTKDWDSNKAYDAGMYIHKGYPGGVSNWSEGCQVFADGKSLNDFFDKCRQHEKRYGNSFTYTLINKKDLVSEAVGNSGGSRPFSGAPSQGGGSSQATNQVASPESQASYNEYRKIVEEIKIIYKLADKTYTDNGNPLFEDLKGTFGDDTTKANERIRELLGLKSSGSFWYNKLPLNKLIADHVALFQNQLSLLATSTTNKNNSFDFNLPAVQVGGQSLKININTDF